MSDWLDILLHGTLDINLPQLTFVQGDSNRFSGSGRLEWQAPSRIRVHAETDGAEALLRNFGRGLGSPGRLIPDSTYLSASGRTQDGWEVQTIRVPTDGYRVHAGSPYVIWNFTTPGLHLTRQATGLVGRTLHALLGPSPKRWTRTTGTEICNKYFGTRSLVQDWLVAQTDVGPVAARRRSDQWFEIRIELDETPCNVLEILNAVAYAFGFALGHFVFLRGYVDLANGREARYLQVPNEKSTINSLPQPLGTNNAYIAGVEKLLGKAINFFLTDEGKRAASYLYHCWDTADSAFSTQLAVASICIEGLLRAFPQISNSKEIRHTEKDLASFERWLNDNPDGLTPHFVSRLRGFFGMIGQRRPIDVLRDWERRGLLGVTNGDIEAWESVRHRSAHGSLIEPSSNPDDLQALLLHYYRVVNLTNRIVLQLIGYEGTYADYADSQWREIDFPATPPEDQ